MARSSDGSVIIEIELDYEGFCRQLALAEKETARLAGGMENTLAAAAGSAARAAASAQGEVQRLDGAIGAANASASRFGATLQTLVGRLGEMVTQLKSVRQGADSAAKSLQAAGTGSGKSAVKGYAAGTSFAQAGWRLVGENGPELVRFAGGESVLNATRTADVTGSAGSAAGREAAYVDNRCFNIRIDDVELLRKVTGLVEDWEYQRLRSRAEGR